MLSYPKKKNEFEIQAELYNFLKINDFDVRGEIKITKKAPLKGARFDLVIFYKKQPLAVVEVKDDPRKHKEQEHGKTNHYLKLTQVPQFTFYADDSFESLADDLSWLELKTICQKD